MNHIRTLPAVWRWTLAALPLAALVAFMLVLSMGSGSKDVQAANGNDFDISAPAKVTIGDSFDLTFTLTKATFGYSAYQLRVDDPDGAFNYPGTDWSADDAENQWSPCANAAGTPADGAFFGSCIQ